MLVLMPKGLRLTLRVLGWWGVEFGEYGGVSAPADPLEYHVWLPQQGLG
jgi:hypothetical protein